jgi:hypothetical protein
LGNAKAQKVFLAGQRSVSDSYMPDAYDELLTRAEVQSHVDKVNLLVSLEAVEDAVVAGDASALVRHVRVEIVCLELSNRTFFYLRSSR